MFRPDNKWMIEEVQKVCLQSRLLEKLGSRAQARLLEYFCVLKCELAQQLENALRHLVGLGLGVTRSISLASDKTESSFTSLFRLSRRGPLRWARAGFPDGHAAPG